MGLDHEPPFTLVLEHPGPRCKMCSLPSELTLAEAYISDDFDIEGDIEAAFDLADYLLGQCYSNGLLTRLHFASLFEKVPTSRRTHKACKAATLQGSAHSKQRAWQAMRSHCDLPPEFFVLWLDRSVVYSCAYLPTGEDADLDTAQCNMLDYIWRKLRVRRGGALVVDRKGG